MADSFHLVVVHDFWDYARGARITDAAEIEKVLATDLARNVVRVLAPADTTKGA